MGTLSLRPRCWPEGRFGHMAIASEAARLIALYAKIALDAESEWDRCDIMLYDHAAAERDIKNLVGLFSHREP